MKIKLYAPAKVNLFLRVLSKRSDGFHNILSLVDIIDLHDVIEIEETYGETITVTEKRGLLPFDEKNTVFKMISVLKERYGVRKGLKVEIEKHIPIGGGLGGSSTDAAEVLKALNRIWNLGLSFKELVEVGKEVGSDVPLFIYGLPCLIEGRGERIRPFSIPLFSYVIVYPGIPLEAKTVYERFVLTKMRDDIKLTTLEDVSDLIPLLQNDLEEVATSLCAEIREVKSELEREGALATLMCGSGSCVFGIFGERKKEESAAIEMKKKGWYTFVTRSLRRQESYADYRS